MVENTLSRLWLEGHPDVKEQLLPTEEEQSAYAAGNRDPEDTKWPLPEFANPGNPMGMDQISSINIFKQLPGNAFLKRMLPLLSQSEGWSIGRTVIVPFW